MGESMHNVRVNVLYQWLLFVTEIVHYVHRGYFDYRGAFRTVLDL